MCLGLVADISNDYSCFAGDFGISSQKPGSDNCIKCMTDNRSIICQRVNAFRQLQANCDVLTYTMKGDIIKLF